MPEISEVTCPTRSPRVEAEELEHQATVITVAQNSSVRRGNSAVHTRQRNPVLPNRGLGRSADTRVLRFLVNLCFTLGVPDVSPSLSW